MMDKLRRRRFILVGFRICCCFLAVVVATLFSQTVGLAQQTEATKSNGSEDSSAPLPPADLVKKWKPGFEFVVGIRLIAAEQGEQRSTSTSWLPIYGIDHPSGRNVLFNSATSVGWFRTGNHWLGEPIATEEATRVRLYVVNREAPEGDRPIVSQFTSHKEFLHSFPIYTEATCYVDVDRKEAGGIEIALGYLGLEFDDALSGSRLITESAIYGVMTPKPLRRRSKFGREESFLLVDDSGRGTKKIAKVRVLAGDAVVNPNLANELSEHSQIPGGSFNKDAITQLTDSQKRPARKGLEFLSSYPQLTGLSLAMTRKEFKEISDREKLSLRVGADRNHYSIPTADGHEVIVMFRGDQCVGIQRLRTGLPINR